MSIGIWLLALPFLLAGQAAAQVGGMSFDACVESLRRELPSHPEVLPQTFTTHASRARDMRPLIEDAVRTQPEFRLNIWDYLARLADDQRADDGRALMQREARALKLIEERHRVDAPTTVAVFGVETDYGRVAGKYPVVDATLSRACLNLQSAERKRHFFAALWLLQEGIVTPEDFKGSWAGAFGMTQFMPATFLEYMRGAPGGPVADIVHSVPDALATTARYLRALGWIDGLPWGVEVKVPEAATGWNALEADHGCLAAARDARKCRSVAAWASGGVRRIDGSSLLLPGPLGSELPKTTPAALLMPAGREGPAWLVTPNYHAIWQYNRSDAYALAIGLLSDALRGLPPRQVEWPTDDPGISRAQFKEVQMLLIQRGHCDVTVDGFNGPLTATSIREEENRLGWPETGRAGARLLVRLRSDRATASSCLSGGPSMSTGLPPARAASAAPVAAPASSGP